jgi:hypothetical protein
MGKQILMLGEDASLLALRALVLAKTGAKVATCPSWQFDPASCDGRIDLLLLCHTVPRRIAVRIVRHAIEHWPEVQVAALESALGDTSVPRGLLTILPAQPKQLVLGIQQLSRAVRPPMPAAYRLTPAP